MKKKIILLILAIAVIAGGIVAIKNKKKSLAELKTPSPEMVTARLFEPKFKQTQLIMQALAEVNSDHEITFTPRFGAMVESIAPIGSVFKKGSLILNLDDTDIKTDLLNLSADLSSAQNDEAAKQTQYETISEIHRRTLELLAVGGASKEQSQNEQAQLASASAALQSVKSRIVTLKAKKMLDDNLLRYTRLIAPYDGIVTQKMANTGDFASIGKPLLVFSGYDGKYLKVKLPQDQLYSALLYNNQKTPLKALESSPDGLATFIARPSKIVENTGAKINVDLIAYDGNATYLPSDTLLRNADGDQVLVFSDGKVTSKKITIKTCNASGCISDDHLEGLKILQASPDALLRALSGTALTIGN